MYVPRAPFNMYSITVLLMLLDVWGKCGKLFMFPGHTWYSSIQYMQTLRRACFLSRGTIYISLGTLCMYSTFAKCNEHLKLWERCLHVLMLFYRDDLIHSAAPYFILWPDAELRFCLFMQLTQITRTGQCTWESKNILAVSFAPLVQQSRADGERPDTVQLRKFLRLCP